MSYRNDLDLAIREPKLSDAPELSKLICELGDH
jgi:hypothetical protein